MTSYLVKNVLVVDSGKIYSSDILIKDGVFSKISPIIDNIKFKTIEIDATGKHLLPGIIDCHVHFREPGLTYKGDISSESQAAIAGGVTSYLDMPNTIPPTTGLKELKDKFAIASKNSYANYGFFLGATNDNFESLKKAKESGSCGIKLFLGSSTGNLVVNNPDTIEKIFSEIDHIITVHAEDDHIIKSNLDKFQSQYGDMIKPVFHSKIRSEEACFKSSSYAVELARKHNTRLHLAHLSTSDELQLLKGNNKNINKRITSEVTVNHLYFDDSDYELLANKIKCNPSIKEKHHKIALFKALISDDIDLIVTDHAPHTISEKNAPYLECPSGIPSIQYSLPIMLEFYHSGEIQLEKIVEKMCHKPALCYNIINRGFAREGYQADFSLIDLYKENTITSSQIFSKCQWSPFENLTLKSSVLKTFVNGELIYDNGRFTGIKNGSQLLFQK